ncbi:MAG: CTP-dependent riboflavin kinase [Ideonella sp.]|nr:CTP-dependent riboflavin kinase [Ideonella sp.]MCC7456472.1 CTP-dependent riboflavin kinase [Nitrospira sp.]
MPARAPEPPAVASPQAASSPAVPGAAACFTGVVCSGLGEGARFVAIDWVQREMRRALGFEPWPGTLNLRMAGTAWQRWRRALAQRPGIVLHPAAGFCAARCFAVRLDGRTAAAAVIPDVDGYPDDKLELVAPLALREALNLRDGSLVRVSFDR